MRMSQIQFDTPKTGMIAAQPLLARLVPAFSLVSRRIGAAASAKGIIGTRRALWSALHLLGAGLFVLAMITRLAQAHGPSDTALSPLADSPAIFLNMERPLPSDPQLN